MASVDEHDKAEVELIVSEWDERFEVGLYREERADLARRILVSEWFRERVST